jgi:hypothetical protein
VLVWADASCISSTARYGSPRRRPQGPCNQVRPGCSHVRVGHAGGAVLAVLVRQSPPLYLPWFAEGPLQVCPRSRSLVARYAQTLEPQSRRSTPLHSGRSFTAHRRRTSAFLAARAERRALLLPSSIFGFRSPRRWERSLEKLHRKSYRSLFQGNKGREASLADGQAARSDQPAVAQPAGRRKQNTDYGHQRLRRQSLLTFREPPGSP